MRKILVTYFSAGGITKQVGERLAGAIGADTFAIVPEAPYTEADIFWKNPFARCNKEKLGKKDVPIAGKCPDPAAYDLILIGFPIWYGGAPNIIRTFLKQYDFSGKKIAIFATSGGSKMGKSAERLKPYLIESAPIIGEKLFQPDDSADLMKEWVAGLPD